MQTRLSRMASDWLVIGALWLFLDGALGLADAQGMPLVVDIFLNDSAILALTLIALALFLLLALKITSRSQ